MADAIVSAVAEQLIAIIKEQIQNEIHLVRGVDKEVLNLSDELKTIRNVLDDAENRRFQDKNINYWLSRLEQTSYQMEDVLDEWNYAILKYKMQKVCSFMPSSCLCFNRVVVRRDIAKKILKVKEQLDQILKEKDRYNFVTYQPTAGPLPKSWRDPSTSFTDLAGVCGRDSDRDLLLTKIMAKGEELDMQVVSIVGVGGLGKTTLAQLVYNDGRVQKFFDLRIWVCVSNPFDLVAIAKGIIESVEKGDSLGTNNLQTLLECVTDSISGKKFLLVLDDVWTEDSEKWEPLKNTLKCGGAGSKILATTRNQRVAEIMGTMDNDILRLGLLTNEECWLLLRNLALSERNKEEFENFEEIGKRIAEKCNGLPLAAKTLGSLLRFKSSLEEWESVLNSEIWKMKEAEVQLFPHLLLSYNELSPTVKRCFSYCAVFPKDSEIDIENLIGNWMALGYLGSNIGDMELEGREYFEVLAMHSLFQDFEIGDLDGKVKSCKMHDIVHDFAQFLRKNCGIEAAEMNRTTCQTCSPSLVSTVNEFCSLFCEYLESPPNFCGCLKRLRVLSVSKFGLESIPRGVENLIHLRWLNLGGNTLSFEDLKIIFHLYNLQTLSLENCSIEEIPGEIGNLINLRHLDLSKNNFLEELPESICGLHELRTLNVVDCRDLRGLPEEIHRLINLKHLHNSLKQFPQSLAQLSCLRTLSEFRGGCGWSKLGLLKNLNLLSGFLRLRIRLTNDFGDVVEDAREAELSKKIHIQRLAIWFDDQMDANESSSSVKMEVMDALKPQPNMRNLEICYYKGFKLPGWIGSPHNKLREVSLSRFNHLTSLPPLGKLPCLEEIYMDGMRGLQFVGREFLGITTTNTTTGGGGGVRMDIQSSSNNVIAFPRLKKLTFEDCPLWEEWEDITAEEEESPTVSLMPCLTELTIFNCPGSLVALPHRLLGKASSLEVLDISFSETLKQRYRDKDGSAWKSISRNNPRLQLVFEKVSDSETQM